MSTGANVQELDALKRLRAQIAKFVDALSTAIADASSDVNRTLHWLELEQTQKWKLELRKRHDKLQQALDALRQKQLFKGPSGERQSYVDEQKRVNQCKVSLEEAEQKLRLIAQHRNKLSREAVLFQGAMARLSSIAHNSGPSALAELGNLITALEKYAKVTVDEVGSSAEAIVEATSAGGPNMARASDSTPMPEEVVIDWDKVALRAADAFARLGGEVVLEPVDLKGRIVILRDGFSSRIYVGPVVAPTDAPPAERPELRFLSLAELAEQLHDLPRVLERAGERRAYFESGELAWQS
jgi:hypothetical protein